MILKGKFPWYSPDMFMSEDARSLFNTLPALQELPHIPTYVMEMQQLINDDNTSAAQLAKVAKKEPLIASNILVIANNLKVDDSQPIDSLEHAISYIGRGSLADIVLTASVGAFPFKTQKFKSDLFWDESFLTGKIAEFLARRYAANLVPDEVYLSGALANVGKVVLAICFPEQADAIAEDGSDVSKLHSWRQGEITHEAHDHTVLGEIAAAFWGLPEPVLQAAGSHHRIPEHGAKEPISSEDIIRFANQLGHWVRLEPTKIEQEILDYSCKKFGLDSAQLDQLAEELIPFNAAS